MDELVWELIFLGYIVWGFYAGNKFLSGRFAWLEKPKPINKTIKFILSGIIGVYIGIFYFGYSIYKFIKLLFD